MLIPVRCISCGKTIGGLWNKYNQRVENGEQPAKVLDALGLTRYCCRSLFITHRDMLNKTAKFKV